MPATFTAPQRGVRGSQKLLEDLAKNGETPSAEEIKKALAMPATVNYQILNFLVRGIPPAYLELDCTLQVPTAHLGEMVQQFCKVNDSTLNLNILVNGIPNVEFACVRVRNTPCED